MNWFELTLVYVIFLAGAEVVNKKTTGISQLDEVVFGGAVQVGTGIVCLVIAVFTGWKFEFTSVSTLMFLAMMMTYIGAVSLYFQGLKRVDLSLAAILLSSGMVWAWILGRLMLDEGITVTKVISGLLILVASGVCFIKKEKIEIGKSEVMLLGASFFYALGAMWDKQLNRFGNPTTYIGLSFFMVGVAVLVVFFKRTMNAMKNTFRMPGFWKSILFNSGAYALGFSALFAAYNLGGEASTMFTMTQGVAIVVSLFGVIFLKERKDLIRKLIAVILMGMGIWILGR
jgi:drug/metabolite transporter (DMT)-like permease